MSREDYQQGYSDGFIAGQNAQREAWQDVLTATNARAVAEALRALWRMPLQEIVTTIAMQPDTALGPWRYRGGKPPKDTT